EALATRGHRIRVATLQNQEAGADMFPFPVDRFRALHFPVRSYFKHFRISSCFPSNYRRLKEIAVTHKSDVVFLINHYLDIAFPTMYAARMLGVPLVCSVGTQLQSLRSSRHAILNMGDRLICGFLVFPFCRKILAWDTQILAYLRDVQGPMVVSRTVIVNFGPHGDCQALLAHE